MEGKKALRQRGRRDKEKSGRAGQLALLAAAWAMLLLLFLGKKDVVFSQAENRYLQTRPDWSWKAFRSGAYGEELEKWFSDQLPGRDDWVRGKTLLARALGRRENQGIYFGKESWLLESFQEYDAGVYQKNLESVSGFLGVMEEQGIQGYLLLAPTAGEVLPANLPAFAPELSQSQLFSQAEAQVPGTIRVEEALKAHSDEYIYYRTDHHWTSLGAYYAYEEFRRQTGREALPRHAYEEEILSKDFYGTSYARAGSYGIPPDSITAMYLPGMEKSGTEAGKGDGQAIAVDYGDGQIFHTLYDRSFLEKRDQYRVFLKGNYPLVTIRTNADNEKKLLLVKDSYANTFVQFLTGDYREIQMVDLRYFKASLMEYAAEQEFTEILVLYQIKKFAQDTIEF